MSSVSYSKGNTSGKQTRGAQDLGERIYEEAPDILNGYFPLPNVQNPWFLLPIDDAGPVYYFINHVLSSRYKRRRFAIALLRIATQLGFHHLWPLVVPMLKKISHARTRFK